MGWALVRGRGCTHILAGLAGNGDFLNDGPFEIVGRGFVVGVVDVVGEAGFVEAFADVFREGLPGGIGLFAAGEEEFNLDAELEGILDVHLGSCFRGPVEWSNRPISSGSSGEGKELILNRKPMLESPGCLQVLVVS